MNLMRDTILSAHSLRKAFFGLFGAAATGKFAHSVAMRLSFAAALCFFAFEFQANAQPASAYVEQSARTIPVLAEVDVLVVGGSSGGVAAATEAANRGASVFLVSEFPYLGEDMTATLRLWPCEAEAGGANAATDDPLLAKLRNDPYYDRYVPDPNRLPLSCAASIQPHGDADSPAKLSDGLWTNLDAHAVRFDGDVSVVADLHGKHEIAKIRAMVFGRIWGARDTDFNTESVAVSFSDDKIAWQQVAFENNSQMANNSSVTLSIPVKGEARYVKIDFKKPENLGQQWIAEIEVIAKTAATQKQPAAPVRPLHVKQVLDQALLDAGVSFLYSSFATDVLRDGDGRPAGAVIANRSGRQAIIAKHIIDATPRAQVARLAKAKFRPFPAGPHKFTWTVIGGNPHPASGDGVECTKVPYSYFGTVLDPYHGGKPKADDKGYKSYDVFAYTITLPMASGSFEDYAKAEQIVRSLTYDLDQQFTSDVLSETPLDTVCAEHSAAADNVSPARLPLAAFSPQGVSHLRLLSGSADVDRAAAERIVRCPEFSIALGRRIGKAAAEDAKQRKLLAGVHAQAEQIAGATKRRGTVREFNSPVRLAKSHSSQVAETPLAAVPQDVAGLPVIGEYDVVVLGGGTAGAPAGIAAAANGRKTLVVEYLHSLGGVGTAGAISVYYFGNRAGFTAQVQDGAAAWRIEQKAQWWRESLLKAGADIWFGAVGCGAVTDGNTLIGAVISTPQGRGVVLAKQFIDATGNSDLAAAAGAECLNSDSPRLRELAVQGTGMPWRELGESYTNTDLTITDDADAFDAWHLLVYAKHKFPAAFDQGKLIDSRERRRIVGEYTLTLLDQMNRRTFGDTVVRAFSNFDTHGYTVAPELLLEHPNLREFYCNIPYRAMLPKDIDNLVVAGLGISAERDAVPMIRMQPDIQNGGYAAGLAASLAIGQNTAPRSIDVRQLQKQLVQIGSLPEEVLTATDSPPPDEQSVAAAVENYLREGKDSAVFLASPDVAVPLLQKAFRAETDRSRRAAAALALAVLGDSSGADALIEEIKNTKRWDRGWDYAIGYGSALSRLDVLIMALGNLEEPKAADAIIEKAALLAADDDFSHFRAVSQALGAIKDPRAAGVLANLLQKPGISGFAHTQIQRAIEADRRSPPRNCQTLTRRESIRELNLAAALFHCGDPNGSAKTVLKEYAKDLRAHFARFAAKVLSQEQNPIAGKM